MLENNCFLPFQDVQDLIRAMGYYRMDCYKLDVPLAFLIPAAVKLWRGEFVTYEEVCGDNLDLFCLISHNIAMRRPEACSIVMRFYLETYHVRKGLLPQVDLALHDALLDEAFHYVKPGLGGQWAYHDFSTTPHKWGDWMFRRLLPFDPPHTRTWLKVHQEFEAVKTALDILPDVDAIQTILEFCSLSMARD